MSQTPFRGSLLAGLLLLLLALAPLSAVGRAQAVAPPAELAAQAQSTSVETLARYVVEVMDKVERYHPAGRELTRQQMIDGARDALIAALRRNEELPVGQRDELVEWLQGRRFTTISQLLHVLHDFSNAYTGLNMHAIADTAAQGVVAATGDPFCRVMTMEEIQELQQQMFSSEDRSLGIAPAPIPTEDGTLRLRVSHIRRGYLGYEMGLRAGDEILAINGIAVPDMQRAQINSLLEADINEEVSFTIRRQGIEQPFTVHGVQRTTSHPAATSRMLPGDIGYVATNMFSLDFGTVVRREVQSLVQRGAVGLILDLRNNPGGAMNACTQVADDFLPEGAVITYTKGTYQLPNVLLRWLQQFLAPDGGERVDDETTIYRARSPQRFDIPLVVLVNKMSASASEMLSGALKSHGRAVIVGETTYGKGVGQTAVMLKSSPSGSGGGLGGMFFGGGGGDIRLLYMTVMTYFGPQGEEVHEIGIEPHVVVPEAQPDAAIFDRVARLRASGAVDEYLGRVLSEHRSFLRQQVLGSPATLDAYPKIETLRAHEAAEGFSDETLLREIRHALLRQFNVTTNLVDDNQLQAAILEVAKLANLSLEGVEEYRHFGD